MDTHSSYFLITMKINHLLIFVLLHICGTITAQDIIIKNDRTELKSKVEEITDTHIRYRKWENINGPIYNMNKAEVFMILHANGEREMIGQSIASLPVKKQENISSPPQSPQTELSQNTSSTSDSNENQGKSKSERADYRPTRLVVGIQSPFELGLDTEVRLIRNFLNIGLTYSHAFPKDDNITSASFGSLYASAYLPINRLLKNYDSQNKGLFIFCSAGLSYNKTDIYNSKTYKSDSYYSDFYTSIRLGTDYYFTKNFGIHFSSYSLTSFYFGLAGKI